MKNSVLAHLTPVAAALTLATLLTNPARAADAVLMSSTATLSDLTYQLIDLDPTDGITPWATFSISGFVGVGSPGSDTTYSSTTGLGPSQSILTATGNGSASALAGPNQIQVYSSIRTSDVLPFNTTNGDYYYQPFASSSGTATTAGGVDPDTGLIVPSVTLSANTLLVITGSATFQRTMDLTPLQSAVAASGASYLSIDGGSNSSITASLISQTNTNEGSNVNGADLNLYSPYDYLYGFVHATTQEGDAALISNYQSTLSPFKLSLANTNATSLDANLSSSLYTTSSLRVAAYYPDTTPPQPAVPEPSTYILTGLGLFAAGAVARKRSAACR